MDWVKISLFLVFMSANLYGQYMIYKTLQQLKVEKLLKLIEKVGEWV